MKLFKCDKCEATTSDLEVMMLFAIALPNGKNLKIDICPSCFEKFLKWMKEKEE